MTIADPDLMHIDDEACRRFLSSTELIGRRWSPGIMLAIGRGAHRFSQIVANVDGLSDRMAAQRLRELEATGLVERSVVPTTPVQVRYALTQPGLELLRSLQPLAGWAHRWSELTDGAVQREAS